MFRLPVHSLLSIALLVGAVSPAAATSAHRRHHRAVAPPTHTAVAPAPDAPELPIDDLYRRRGTGIGGLVFGGGQGGFSQAGACADLAFAESPRCGARGGYGPYGNGFGYGFGSP